MVAGDRRIMRIREKGMAPPVYKESMQFMHARSGLQDCHPFLWVQATAPKKGNAARRKKGFVGAFRLFPSIEENGVLMRSIHHSHLGNDDDHQVCCTSVRAGPPRGRLLDWLD